MKDDNKKPLVILLIEGFGLTSSWAGNAFLTAKAKNIDFLWQSSRHFALKNIIPKNKHELNADVFLSMISTGKEMIPNSSILTGQLKGREILNNPEFNELINHTDKHKSTIHIAGTISEFDEYGSIWNLLEICQLLKEKSIFNVSIHLFLGDISRQNAVKKLETLQKKLESLGIGEIATISGASYLNVSSKSSIEKILLAMVKNKAETALSAAQAISLHGKNTSLSYLKPCLILKNRKPIARVRDFDSLISFNHDNEGLVYLLSAIKSGYKNVQSPRFIEVLVFFSTNPLIEKNFKIAMPSIKEKTISQILLENKIKQLYISDWRRLNSIDNYFIGNENIEKVDRIYLSKENSTIENLLKTSLMNIEKKYDFILIDIPHIFSHSANGNIKKAIAEIRELDEIIVRYAQTAINKGYDLVITSNVGSAEKIQSSPIKMNISDNPIPFMYINQDIDQALPKKGASPIANHLICDILKKRYLITDIRSTVLNLFNIKSSGKNILER